MGVKYSLGLIKDREQVKMISENGKAMGHLLNGLWWHEGGRILIQRPPAQPDIEDCPSGEKPPWLSFPLLGHVPRITSRSAVLRHPTLGGCCTLGCNAASLVQLWSVLVMALAIALLVLGVLGAINAFSFPPSLSSLSVLTVLPRTALGPSFACVSTCFFFSDHAVSTRAAVSSHQERAFPQLEAH